MKGNHWFIAGIIVFLVLMFAIECRLPKKFVWNPTFSHYDKQPFGCAVFDSLLSSSLPKGYSLSRKTFYELEQEDTTLRRGILVVTDNLHLTDVDVVVLSLPEVRRGRLVQVSERWEWLLLSACPLWRWHTLSEESRAVILILPLPWAFCCPAG